MTTLACVSILIHALWMPGKDLEGPLALLPPLYIRTEISTGYSERGRSFGTLVAFSSSSPHCRS